MDKVYTEGLDPHGVATDREAVALPAQKEVGTALVRQLAPGHIIQPLPLRHLVTNALFGRPVSGQLYVFCRGQCLSKREMTAVWQEDRPDWYRSYFGEVVFCLARSPIDSRDHPGIPQTAPSQLQ